MTSASTKAAATRWRDLIVEGRLPRFALVCAGTWLNAADGLMTATIMPSAAKDIGGYSWFGWAVAVFMLGSIIAGATSGRLALRLGLRPALALGGAAYALGCAASALSPSIGPFLLGRLLQGMGGGWVIGLCYVAVTRLFPEHLWRRVLSSLAGVWGAATVLSPLIGGLFAQAGFWRGAFWLFAAQGLAFIVASALLVRREVRPADEAKRKGSPALQLVFLTLGVVAIAVAGQVSGMALAVVLGVAGLLAMVAFIRIDAGSPANLLPRRAADPGQRDRSRAADDLLPGDRLRRLRRLWASLDADALSRRPNHRRICHRLRRPGLDPGRPGGGRPAAQGRRAVYPRRRGSGPAVVACLAIATPHGGLIAIAVCALTMGAGFGAAWSFTTSRIVADSVPGEQALASSSVPTAQMIGSAVGAAAAGAIAGQLGFGRGIDASRAAQAGFWLFVAFIPVAAAGCLAAWRVASPQFRDQAG